MSLANKVLMILAAVVFLSPAESSAFNSAITPDSRNNSSVVDSHGLIHTVFISPSGKKIFYQSLNPANSLHTISAIPLARSEFRFRRPQVQLGRDGSIHVLWQERFKKGPNSKNLEGTWVHYASFSPAGIEKTGSLKHFRINRRPQALHPSLSLGENSMPTIAWEEGQSGGVMIVRMNRQGLPMAPVPVPIDGVHSSGAFPAALMDRSGVMHLVWTESSPGSEDRLVHSTLVGPELRLHSGKKVLYSVPAALGQRKSLSIDASGRLELQWTAKQADGFIAGNSQNPNRLKINRDGLAGGLVDKHLRGVGFDSWAMGKTAALAKRTPVSPPRKSGILAPDSKDVSGLITPVSAGIEKKLKRRVLEFSSWSGAPPAGESMLFSEPACPPALLPADDPGPGLCSKRTVVVSPALSSFTMTVLPLVSRVSVYPGPADFIMDPKPGLSLQKLTKTKPKSGIILTAVFKHLTKKEESA